MLGIQRVAWRIEIVLVVLTTGNACAGRASIDTQPEASTIPVITRLEPSSGMAGRPYPIQLQVHGRGFQETSNVVTFGAINIPDLPSVDGGTRITLSVPKVIPATGEVPPFVLLPGEYAVTVTTSEGTSTPVVFTLVRPQESAQR